MHAQGRPISLGTPAQRRGLLVIVTLLVIVGSATLIGAVLLTLGLRGRRIDDHPVCARCRFDLSGAPEPRTTCPECGRDVSTPKAIKVGQRRRRPRMLMSGAAALAVSLLIWGVAGWGLWKGTNWNTYKPTGWLLFEARVGAPGEADAAISEVADRVVSKSPPGRGQLNQFVEVVLAHQADHMKPWSDGWRKAIDVLIEEEMTSEDQLEAVFHNAYSFDMDARPTTRLGDPIIVRLIASPRLGRTQPSRSVLIEATRTIVNGVEVEESLGRMHASGRSSMATSVPATQAGPAELVVHFRYAFAESLFDSPEPEEWTPFVRSTTVSVVSRNSADGVRLVANEAERAAIRKSLQNMLPGIQRSVPLLGPDMSVTIDRPPLDLAFEVYVRQGDAEWRVGSVVGRRGETRSTALRLHDARLGPANIDVIFRASEAAIRRTIEMNSAWDGEIVFEDLPWSLPGKPSAK